MRHRFASSYFRLSALLFLGGWLQTTGLYADNIYPFTLLIPEHDSRDLDVQDWDEFDTKSMVHGMNMTNDDVFHGNLTWGRVRIRDLLSTCTPFCYLRFDAVKPLMLTDEEKLILQEYFVRGGFIVFQQDAYPYEQEEFWSVKEWPVVDFLAKELPAISRDFRIEKITDKHDIFHQYFDTRTADSVRHELKDNPYTPNRTLLYYRDSPCAFVYGSYSYVMDNKWVAMPRPFPLTFSPDPKSYELDVNIYVYAAMH